MTWADMDDSVEAWTDHVMQPRLGGSVFPAYFGSWTSSLAYQPTRPPEVGSHGPLRAPRGRVHNLPGRETASPEYYSVLPSEGSRVRVFQDIFEAQISIL